MTQTEKENKLNELVTDLTVEVFCNVSYSDEDGVEITDRQNLYKKLESMVLEFEKEIIKQAKLEERQRIIKEIRANAENLTYKVKNLNNEEYILINTKHLAELEKGD